MQKNNLTLIHGDAFEELAKLETGSVDCVCTDPPYGTTSAPWDKAPNWGRLFNELWRVLKPDGTIVMFSQNPVAADIITLQRKFFRYEWVWVKNMACGFLNVKKAPLRAHELALVFYRSRGVYNNIPIPEQAKTPYKRISPSYKSEIYSASLPHTSESKDGARRPRDVIHAGHDKKRYHSTQKPQMLLRAILSQYCKPGDVVLDPFMGSGSTLIAARLLGFSGIGIEADPRYFDVALQRCRENVFCVS